MPAGDSLDRDILNGQAERLHQEDFCQALGIPSDRKYEAEGGPGLIDGFALLRSAVEVPARQTPLLLDYFALASSSATTMRTARTIPCCISPTAPAPRWRLHTTCVRRGLPQSATHVTQAGHEHRG